VKFVLAGGSGQIGRGLASALLAAGHQIVVLSRHPTPGPARSIPWDAKTVGEWASEVDGADIVVNLAGRNVNCRYTAANRRAIMDSRVESTTAIGKAIAHAGSPPRVWLQASTATIYAHRYDADNDERHGQIGGNEPNAPPSGVSASTSPARGRRQHSVSTR
jgi:hypothetical protein